MSFSSILRGIFSFTVNPMAPGNMKSEFVGLQRNKIVSKSAQSRKSPLARTGANIVDGCTVVVNMAMVAEGRSPSDASNTASPTSNPKTTGDGDHARPGAVGTKSPKLGGQDNQVFSDDEKLMDTHAVQHLKEMSMLHLDVIEQQQQELQKREKELQKVRAQNDTLKARLERIQRRTVLAQKHHEPLLNNVHTAALAASGGDNSKRKHSLEVATPIKKHNIEKETTPSNTPTSTRRMRLKFHANQHSLKKDRSPRTTDDKSRCKRDKPLRLEERTPRKEFPGSKVKEDKRHSEQDRSGVKGEQYSKTGVIYPCLSDLRVTDPDPAMPEGQTVVKVPAWRVNIVSSSISTDIIEDIEDTAFEKRHQRYEQAEQKRKRWDIQRVRELREHERLEQKMLRREYGNWDDVLKTFYPEPSDASQLQVTDAVPLVAFGVQVPLAKDGEFDLPWYSVNEREKEESMRQTRSRTNRR